MKTLEIIEAFEQERAKGIGSSDVGAIKDLDFGCKRRLAYEKSGIPPDYPRDYSPELERGEIMEFAARAVYEKRTRRKVTEPGKLLTNPRYPFALTHVDGLTTDPRFIGQGIVEFKVINRFMMSKFKKEGIRDSYILQLQHSMMIGALNWGSYGLLCLDPWQFEWFDVERDDSIIEEISNMESTFWLDVQEGLIPDALKDPKDKRCISCRWRHTCRGTDFLETDVQDDSKLEHRPDLEGLVAEVMEAKEIVQEASEIEKDAKERLTAAIGKAYGIITQGYRAIIPSWTEQRWDTKLLNGLEAQAKITLDKDEKEGIYEGDFYRTMTAFLKSFLKAKRPPYTKSALRIYPTGDKL